MIRSAMLPSIAQLYHNSTLHYTRDINLTTPLDPPKRFPDVGPDKIARCKFRKPRSWELPDSVVTREADYFRRRDFLRVVGLGVAATATFPARIRAATAGFPDALDPAFKLDGVKRCSW